MGLRSKELNMNCKIAFGDRNYFVDLAKGKDISIPMRQDMNQVNCFYAPFFQTEPVKMGTFVGSVEEGGPVNFVNIKMNVHGNGTHTEGYGHISREFYPVNKLFNTYFFLSTVVSVYPTKLENGDLRIERSTLEIMLENKCNEAICIRTLPNDVSKQYRKYSGSNPPYFQDEAIEYLINLGVKHLLIDLPSVDREEDNGVLKGHNLFWSEKRKNECTITELIFIPDEISDGEYLLNIQLADIESDAVPSRPVLYMMQNEF